MESRSTDPPPANPPHPPTLNQERGTRNTLIGRAGIVTGAAQGIGEGIAAALSSEGAALLLADLDEAKVQTVAARLAAMPGAGQCFGRRCDVGDPAAVQSLIAATLDAFGRLDLLVNNAGLAVYKGIEDTSEAEWRRVVDVNLSACFYTIKYAAPHLRAARGAVVNIASGRAERTTPGVFAYTAAKAGVVGLTRAAALDLAPDVRVNAILPGAVDTPMHRANVAATTDLDEGMHRIREVIPLRRHGQPSDIAQLVLFLVGDASSWITGAAYAIDGGQSAVLP